MVLEDSDTSSGDELSVIKAVLDKRFDKVGACGTDPDEADVESEGGADEERQID